MRDRLSIRSCRTMNSFKAVSLLAGMALVLLLGLSLTIVGAGAPKPEKQARPAAMILR